ncbi:hypothetical protein Lal_00046426 [Lupinus albus]|nr:hypothetical protein Lal_00046426 [Lupinus albus]
MLKHHLAGTNKDVGPCIIVSDDVKKEMLLIIAGLQQNLINKSNTSSISKEEHPKVDEKMKEDETYSRRRESTLKPPSTCFRRELKRKQIKLL